MKSKLFSTAASRDQILTLEKLILKNTINDREPAKNIKSQKPLVL